MKFSNENWKSFGSVVLMFSFLLLIGKPLFETNDDMAIIGILSGKFGQPASSEAIFIAKPISIFLMYLYQKFPTFPWYGAFLYTVHFIASWIIFSRIYSSVNSATFLRALTIVYVSLYFPIFYRVNFTSTSLLLWFSVLLYSYTLFAEKGEREYIFGKCISFTLLVMSILIRPSIFFIAFAYSALWMSVVFIEKRGKAVFKYLLFILSAIFVALSIHYSTQSEEFRGFWEYNQAVASFQGLPKERTLDKTLLEDIQWSKVDFKMANLWWYHDEEVFSKEKLQKCADDNLSYIISFENVQMQLKALFNNNTVYILLLFFALMGKMEMYSNVIINSKLQKVFWGSFTVGTIILCIVRFPLRVNIPVFIFAFLTSLFFIDARRINEVEHNKKNKWWGNKSFLIAFCCVLVFYIFNTNKGLLNEYSNKQIFKSEIERDFSIVKSMNGEDTLFVFLNITTVIDSVNPLSEYRHVLNFNLLPGGWVQRTPTYFMVLNKMGLSKPSDVPIYIIDNDEVVVSFYDSGNSNLLNDFEMFLNQHYADYYPGRKIKASIYFDNRVYQSEDLKKGLVFVKLRTYPKQVF